jgi:hypothetical protein
LIATPFAPPPVGATGLATPEAGDPSASTEGSAPAQGGNVVAQPLTSTPSLAITSENDEELQPSLDPLYDAPSSAPTHHGPQPDAFRSRLQRPRTKSGNVVPLPRRTTTAPAASGAPADSAAPAGNRAVLLDRLLRDDEENAWWLAKRRGEDACIVPFAATLVGLVHGSERLAGRRGRPPEMSGTRATRRMS